MTYAALPLTGPQRHLETRMTRLERKQAKRIRRLEAALAAVLWAKDRRDRRAYEAMARAHNTANRDVKPSRLLRMAVRLFV